MKLQISEIAGVIGGELYGDDALMRRTVEGICWDSRKVEPQDIFIAMPGEHVDGNVFIASAVRKGAGAVICTRRPSDNVLAVAGEFTCPVFIVDDVQPALFALAGLWRDKIHAIVVGVTGSTGKTSTKDFLRSVLSQRFKTCATVGNYNNEIGVPATVLSAEEDTEILIVELGMRGLHQIEDLCTFVKPNIGVITNVGVSHMELLGSRENIALAKSELLKALPSAGHAVLNADDEYTPLLKEYGHIEARNINTHLYGFAESADVRASEPKFDSNACAQFDLHGPDGQVMPVELHIPGRHNVHNALAAASVGLYLGLTSDEIVRGLQSVRPSGMRMEVLHSANGITVINDAYNANPDSMRASLDTISQMDCIGRRIAVLGDMGELGENEYQLHIDVGTYAASSTLDMLVCVGTLALGIKSGALAADMNVDKIKSFATVEEAQEFLARILQSGDLLLVKASRFMEMERIVKGVVG